MAAPEICSLTRGNRHRAELLARTLSLWAYNEGAMQLYADEGVGAVEWMATEDDLTCPYCMAIDGAQMPTGEPFGLAGDEIDGLEELGGGVLTLQFDTQHPPLHPHCRCILAPVVLASQVKGVPDKAQPSRDAENTALDAFEAALVQYGAALDVDDVESFRGQPEVREVVQDSYKLAWEKGQPAPRRVAVDPAHFIGWQNRKNVVAAYDDLEDIIRINIENRVWRESVEQVTMELYGEGVWSTDSKLHAILHEIGHGAHARNSQAYRKALTQNFDSTSKTKIEQQISRQASEDGGEFVAEVFVMNLLGKKVPRFARTWYNRLGGP